MICYTLNKSSAILKKTSEKDKKIRDSMRTHE